MNSIDNLNKDKRYNDPGVICEKAYGKFFPIFDWLNKQIINIKNKIILIIIINVPTLVLSCCLKFQFANKEKTHNI